jgi:protein phosphatase
MRWVGEKMRYLVDAVTDIGSQKTINQDCYLVKTAHTNLGNVCMALICDGMGGLKEGEKASGKVVEIFNVWFENTFRIINEANIDRGILDTQIQELIKKANYSLMEYGIKKDIKLGTTASIIVFIEGSYATYHIGDTRIYKYDNSLVQLTLDHSLVASKVRNGQMTKAQAKASSEKNILIQCLGVNDFIDTNITKGSSNKDDIFLLCCDGFYNRLEEFEISEALEKFKNVDKEHIEKEIRALVKKVQDRGETDNISAVIIRLE